MNLEQKQRLEVDFWKNSLAESPYVDSIENIINKASEAKIFFDILHRYKADFDSSKCILEIGGGQGWASCIVKKLFPKAKVLLTDISEHAIKSVYKWEDIYKVKLDNSFPCVSYDIPLANNSVDLVFCFAAAHHFVAHRRTFKELTRVLKPGGVCIYMYEPSCKPYIYRIAYQRVNKNRLEVPEDVLIYPKMESLASEFGFKTELGFYPSTQRRYPKAFLYYLFLKNIPIFQKILPCTINYKFKKLF